ncbi:putative Fe-S radical SAM superfamily protein PflX [Paenibacillus polymyxa]
MMPSFNINTHSLYAALNDEMSEINEINEMNEMNEMKDMKEKLQKKMVELMSQNREMNLGLVATCGICSRIKSISRKIEDKLICTECDNTKQLK